MDELTIVININTFKMSFFLSDYGYMMMIVVMIGQLSRGRNREKLHPCHIKSERIPSDIYMS